MLSVDDALRMVLSQQDAFVGFQDEAFALWREQWGRLYDEKSQSQKVIQGMIDNYCLVNLVDNDFPQKSCLFDIIHLSIQLRHEAKGVYQFMQEDEC